MAAALSREAYFDTGLEVLSELGYGGLKLAEVCKRLGVTTGSFYHFFTSWPVYTSELIQHWLTTRTVHQMELVLNITDARQRLDALIEIGLLLPHRAEAAIRSWSSADQRVHAVQAEVDRQRFEILRDAALEVRGDPAQAHLFASCAMYLLIGYEQSLLPGDATSLHWMAAQLLDTLDSGRFGMAHDIISSPIAHSAVADSSVAHSSTSSGAPLNSGQFATSAGPSEG